MKVWLISGAVALLAAAACGNQADLQTDPSPSVSGDTVEVQVAIAAAAATGALSIRFDEVEGDSRCPLNVVCVWEGNAAIRLTLTSAGNSQEFTLNSRLEPREIEFAGRVLIMAALVPYPVAGEPTDPNQYVATLAVVASG